MVVLYVYMFIAMVLYTSCMVMLYMYDCIACGVVYKVSRRMQTPAALKAVAALIDSNQGLHEDLGGEPLLYHIILCYVMLQYIKLVCHITLHYAIVDYFHYVI